MCQDKVKKLEGQLKAVKEAMAERDLEVKIIRREREELLHAKMELAQENKKLKVCLDSIIKSSE